MGSSTSPSKDDAFPSDFAVMSTFGATSGGGVARQAATLESGQTHKWFANWLSGHGFRVERDRIGNPFAFLELIPGAPYVLAGSHLDSQPRGGKFDGAYGVLAAAHAAVRVQENYRRTGARAAANIAVVDWFNEEGSRFKPSMMGSAVFTGKLDLEEALTTTDGAGATVREALSGIGELGSTVIGLESVAVAAYVEIHIEQGKILGKRSNGYRPGCVYVGGEQARDFSPWQTGAYGRYRHGRPSGRPLWRGIDGGRRPRGRRQVSGAVAQLVRAVDRVPELSKRHCRPGLYVR